LELHTFKSIQMPSRKPDFKKAHKA